MNTVMEVDGSDGCTVLMHLMSLNCTFKNDEELNFMLYAFYHTKKVKMRKGKKKNYVILGCSPVAS